MNVSTAAPAVCYGVDEAGRGPVLGPMILAVVGLDPQREAALISLGVADSKAFGSSARAKDRRRALAQEIRRTACWSATLSASPSEIDARVRRGELNLLERELAATLLRGAPLKPSDTIVCDGARLFAPLAEQFSNLQAMDKAESKSTSVAAASILAKDLRDAAFEEIAQRYRESYGELRGGGYPNAATRAFLDWHLAEFGALPPETRTSWGQRTRPSSTTR